MLTREQILEADDLKNQSVDVPEWGGTVLVRSMTGADRDAFEASMMTVDAEGNRKADMGNMRAKLVALTAVNEAGALLFVPADVERLALKSAGALERVFVVAQQLNGLGPQAEAQALKNSVPAQSESSISG